MADYVAGSLSALFSKKLSPSDGEPGIGGDGESGRGRRRGQPVKLLHVKQMYEEFEPRKAPREVGRSAQEPRQQQQRQQRHEAEGNVAKKRKRFAEAQDDYYTVPFARANNNNNNNNNNNKVSRQSFGSGRIHHHPASAAAKRNNRGTGEGFVSSYGDDDNNYDDNAMTTGSAAAPVSAADKIGSTKLRRGRAPVTNREAALFRIDRKMANSGSGGDGGGDGRLKEQHDGGEVGGAARNRTQRYVGRMTTTKIVKRKDVRNNRNDASVSGGDGGDNDNNNSGNNISDEETAATDEDRACETTKGVTSDDARASFRYYEDDPQYISRTIFVKNLPPKTRRKQMKKLFGHCGEILFVRFSHAVPTKSSIPAEAAIKRRSLIKDGTTICAYIVFSDIDSVPAALKLNGAEFEGHHLRVDKREASSVPAKRSVFCGNLAFDTTDDELWEFFAEAGGIDYVRVVRDSHTGNGKGIAFVVFQESASALMALEFSGRTFKGRTIRVTAVEKKRHSEAAGAAHGIGATSKNIQVSGSKERINKKKKVEKKALQQERKQPGLKNIQRMGKQKREKIKKNIKREKMTKLKKTLAKKLQGKS